MKPQEIRVTFQPTGRNVYVLPGTSLLEAAGLAGIILQTPCGGKGTCGKCRLKITMGAVAPQEESAALSRQMIEQGYCLACRTTVTEPLTVEVPRESTFESEHRILVTDSGETSTLDPVVRKVYFELPPPTIEDPRSDLTRLKRVIGEVDVPHAIMRVLPTFLRTHNWQGTATLANHSLISLEAGNTSDLICGMAFDIGTTTVVGKLYNLCNGRELAIVSRINPQVTYGDDVISRINLVRENPAKLAVLQSAIIECVSNITATAAEQAGVSTNHIYEIVIAGNSTMQQIFCGMNPSALGEMPFVQTFSSAQTLSAGRLGIKANAGARVYVFPQIQCFVGGDTVAGIVAARLDTRKEAVLFIDIGTNGEIVLANNDYLIAASTAAGPAFEGARIKQGMRATAGAIEKVIIANDVVLNVIANTKPAGLCGTGLIDTVAELLRKGIIDDTGRILNTDEVDPSISDALKKRLITDNDGNTRFELAGAAETIGGEALYLWQKDVRELQLATGAIRAGCNILLRKAGLNADDIGEVLLAGAFGNFIRRSNARRIGLLPEIPCDRIRFIGNASSLGAKLALLSSHERRYAEELRTRTKHVDLSLDTDFQMEFGSAMIFPARDIDTCRDD